MHSQSSSDAKPVACDYPAIICIQGPTACGKSELAELIACELDGEIISADSMQVYRGMNIGTAKISPQKRGVAYHCIDLIDPGKPYSAALFQRDGRAAVSDICARGKRVLLCGGTGFYLNAVVCDMDFANGGQQDNFVREYYTQLAEEIGPKALHDLLFERDPKSAALIHPNNVRRVIRAFEMLEQGESYAKRKEAFSHIGPYLDSVRIGLEMERSLLYRRIEARVDKMIQDGLVEEVRGLLKRGFRNALTADQAIGYKEIVSCLDGKISLDEAIAAIKQATRRYAKRQMSWLYRDKSIRWLNVNQGVNKEVLSLALQCISEKDHQR